MNIVPSACYLVNDQGNELKKAVLYAYLEITLTRFSAAYLLVNMYKSSAFLQIIKQ